MRHTFCSNKSAPSYCELAVQQHKTPSLVIIQKTFAEFDTQDSLFLVLGRVGVDIQWRMKGGVVQWMKSLLVIWFSLDIQLDGIKSRV